MRELKQRFWLRLSTWLVLSSCFSVLIGAALMSTNLERLLTLWGDEFQVTAYLAPDTGEDVIEGIRRRITAEATTGKVEFVGRERALKEFREQLASYAPDLAGDEELLSLIPSSFQISLPSGLPPEKHEAAVAEMAGFLGKIPGIEEVRYGQEWIKKYAGFVSAARGASFFVNLILLAAALLVIGNSVRASVEARRHEIEVYELVGATPAMIRKPFLTEGALLGGAAALTAVLVTTFAFHSVRSLIAHELGSGLLASQLHGVGWSGIAGLVLGGAALGALASYLCVRRINSGYAASEGRG